MDIGFNSLCGDGLICCEALLLDTLAVAAATATPGLAAALVAGAGRHPCKFQQRFELVYEHVLVLELAIEFGCGFVGELASRQFFLVSLLQALFVVEHLR